MSAADDCRILAGGLQLCFDWSQDRFGHAISLRDETNPTAASIPLVLSLEGNPDELWPASPVLQELHTESRAGGRSVALLVGRAGRSHWSLSVLADPQRSELLFEVACRCGAQPDRLGSTYRVADAANCEKQAPREPDRGALNRDNEFRHRPPSRQPGVWLASGAGDRCWRLTPAAASSIAIRDPSAAAAPLAFVVNLTNPWPAGNSQRTIQWSYRVWLGQEVANVAEPASTGRK